jgi:hypothetical protein
MQGAAIWNTPHERNQQKNNGILRKLYPPYIKEKADNSMKPSTNKTPSVIATAITIILLITLAVLSVLFEMLALNGASESQGVTAMGISLACQSVGLILIGIFTWRSTRLLISKFGWNAAAAVIVSVIGGTVLGMGISFLSALISIPVAGIH